MTRRRTGHDPDDMPDPTGPDAGVGAKLLGGAIAAFIGIAFTVIATIFQGGSLLAYQRQADALERIAAQIEKCGP